MASIREHIAAGVRAALQGPTKVPRPAPGARADTAGTVSTTSAAALVNPISGLGSADDSGAASRPNLYRELLTMEELVMLLRGSLYRRICNVLPMDAMRRGLIVTDDTRRSNPLRSELQDFEVPATLRRAAMLGRALGSAWIWPVVEDGGAPLSEPLDLSRVTRLYALHVLDPNDLSVRDWNRNLRAPGAGTPRTYSLEPRRPDLFVPAGTVIHHSRLIPFWGDELPPSENLWSNPAPLGDAIAQTMWDGLRNLTQTSAAGARLAEELSIAVFYLAKLPEKDASSGRDPLRAAWNNIMRFKSIAHGILLGTGDKAERLGANAAGFDTLTEAGWETLQALSGIPAARLRGNSPGGLSTDGASWQQSYYNDVDAWALERLLPPARRIVDLLYRHRGVVPDSWEVTFGPFYHLSMIEQAQLRLATAQHDQLAEQAGWVTGEQIRRSRYSDGGWSFDLQPATDQDELLLGAGATSVDPNEAEMVLAELTGGAGAAASTNGQPAEPMNGAQIVAVKDLLGAMSAGELTPEATRLALEGVVSPAKARALVEAQHGAPIPPMGSAPVVAAPIAPDAVAVPTTDDAPDLSAQRDLAASMTEHGVDRCSHGGVNRCRICGVERIHALSMGEDGKPLRDADGRPVWAVKWRAIGDTPAKPEDHPASDEIATDRADADDFRRARFKVPAGAKGNARKVLAWKKEHGAAVKGMTDTGWARARQLAGEDTVTGQDLIEMAAWFARHGADAATRKVAEVYKSEPWRDAGWVSWLGWGGDTARTWAQETVNRSRSDADFTGKAMLAVTLSEAGRAMWADLAQRAGAIVGALEGYEPGEPSVVEAPHVTVLYLGAVPDLQLPEIERRARAIVEDLGPIALRAVGVTTFPPGPTSEGRVTVVVEVRAWELDELYNRLLRALAPFVTADQFARFRPHVTLGFAADPTPEQVAALVELLPGKDVPGREPVSLGSVASVDLHHGKQVVARLPLLGKRADEADAAVQP